MSERDAYGIDRKQATRTLDRYLKDTLHDPQAKLDDVHLKDGSWRSHVSNSQRGITVVFLRQHADTVAPGFMNADSGSELFKKRTGL